MPKPSPTSTARRGNGTGTMLPRTGKGAWRARYYDHDGRRVTRSTKTTDRRAADRILAQWIAEVSLRRERVVDAGMDKIRQHTLRPIDQHVDDYLAHIAAKGRGTKHIAKRRTQIEAGVEACGWATVADIHRDDVDRYVVALKDRGLAATTQASRVGALTGFTRWLHASEKIARDPLIAVAKPSIAGKQTIRRRALLPEEWPWLHHAAQNGPIIHGLTGPERATLYATALQTALRSGEIKSLTAGRLHTHAVPPYVLVAAADTKSSKRARQYITQDLAQELDALVSHKAPGAKAWVIPDKPAKTIRRDLLQARADWIAAARHDPQEHKRRQHSDFLEPENAEGEVLDFHALRHTAGAWLCMRGEQPKVVQEFMRHSTITLTMDTYGHLFPGQAQAAIRHFDDLMPTPDQPQAATGTTHATPPPAPNAPTTTPPKTKWDRSAHSQRTPQCATPRDPAPDPPDHAQATHPKTLAKIGPNEPPRATLRPSAHKTPQNPSPPTDPQQRTSNARPLAAESLDGGCGAGLGGAGGAGRDSGAPFGADGGSVRAGAAGAGAGAPKDGRPWVVQVAEAAEGLSAPERGIVLWVAQFIGGSTGSERRRRMATVRQFLADVKTKGEA